MNETDKPRVAGQVGTAVLVLLLVAPFAVTIGDIATDPSDPGFGARDFPRLVVYPAICFSLLLLAVAGYRHRAGCRMELRWPALCAEGKAVCVIAGIALLYVGLMVLVQYAVSTLIVMIVTVRYFGSHGLFRTGLVPVLAVCLYYLVFFVIFGLYEEPGLLLSYDSYSVAKAIREAIGLR